MVHEYFQLVLLYKLNKKQSSCRTYKSVVYPHRGHVATVKRATNITVLYMPSGQAIQPLSTRRRFEAQFHPTKSYRICHFILTFDGPH